MTSRALAVFLLLAGSAVAQHDNRTATQQVRVRVVFTNGGCDTPTHVTLMSHNSMVADAAANDKCEAQFFNVPAGSYQLSVSGKTLSDADSGRIEVTSAGSAEFEVKVKRTSDFDWNSGVGARAFVSASDLGIPARARKEFSKANELLAKQEWMQALRKLNNAIAIYPAYAGAYNNMGVIYSRLGEHDREREALQKAININDHFALAYLNVGRMNIAASDFSGAEAALNKAAAFDPSDPVTLLLLAYADFMGQRFDDAVATSRKAHALQEHPALVHRIAARALEQERQAAGAISELEQFLAEEPTGPHADAARKELEIVRSLPR